MLMYMGHLVSFAVYIAIIITTASCAARLRHTVLYGHYKKVIWLFVISLKLQAASFMILQWEWIYMDYNEAVGDVTAYGWLAFDYFNGFALLSFATALRMYLGWKQSKNHDDDLIYRGRAGDHPPP